MKRSDAERPESRQEQRDQNPEQESKPECHCQQRHHQVEPIDQQAAGIERVHGGSGAASGLPAFAAGKLQQQELGQRKHDERDHKQDEAEFDQRGRIEVAYRLGEFVGERRGDAVAGLENRRVSWCALPMRNVTAIVSPSARPRPSMMPPITPTFVYGSTMFRTTSQVVHRCRTPTPSAPAGRSRTRRASPRQ